MFNKKIKDGQKIGYNIEYAHAYADSYFNQEHEKSVTQLQQTINKYELH